MNKPEDLPDSVIRSFREQELGNDVGICCMPVLLFVSCCCFYCAINTIGMKKQYQAVTAEEAVKVIKSGDHVHISSVSNVPQCLVKALCERAKLIISVAHPQFQEELEEAAFKRFGSHYHYICKNSII